MLGLTPTEEMRARARRLDQMGLTGLGTIALVYGHAKLDALYATLLPERDA